MAKTEPVKKRLRKAIKRSPVGSSPGTLVADPNAAKTALTLTLISPESYQVIEDASISDLQEQRGKWPIIWLDCVGLGNIDLIVEIGDLFGLHPLALEDTVNAGQRPKVDFYEDHAFVIVSMIDDPKSNRYEQISTFFCDDFVITFQERKGDPFNAVRKRIDSSNPNRIRERKADYLAYALIDAVVDSYFPIIDDAGETVEKIEDEMLQQAAKHQVRQLHVFRRDAMALKRAVWPLRDVLAGLTRAEVPFIRAETRVFLNDTLDHSIRLIELVETQREMLTGLIEMHLSLTQQRTNEIISFLTVVTAIFIPLTFLAGIWGMNFDPSTSPWNMPELLSYYGYPAALGSMLFVALGLISYFKWKKWL
ncbi:MAG TPA: magnesium/cobalt transporter CorA [Rhizobiaceae bacterium]|nr:magnesium/cobalt transporter CorA [Rhizobiaceae bacterium]